MSNIHKQIRFIKPVVGLVQIEKDVIPVILWVNMHLIKGTWIIFPFDLAGYKAILWSIGTNGSIGTNKKGCHSNGSVGESASH